MKWSLQQLYKYNGKPFDFEIDYDFKDYIKNIDDVLDIKEIHVEGTGQNLYDDRFRFDLHITGCLILQCARTLDEVEFPIDLEVAEVYDKVSVGDEDIRIIEKNTIDLEDAVWEDVILEKPIRVVLPSSEDLEEE